MIGTAAVAQAKPDGYTLLHGAAVSLTVLPLTDMQAGYTHESFEPICQTFKNEQVDRERARTRPSIPRMISSPPPKPSRAASTTATPGPQRSRTSR